MIKFLLQRPIAVLMVFLACVIIGIITYSTLPVSLLPDIAISEITVQVKASVNYNTRLVEGMNVRVRTFRSAGKQWVVPKRAVVLLTGRPVVFTVVN